MASLQETYDTNLQKLQHLPIPLVTAEGPTKGKIDQAALLASVETLFPTATNAKYAKQLTHYIVNELETKKSAERVFARAEDGTIGHVKGRESYEFVSNQMKAELRQAAGLPADKALMGLGDQPGTVEIKIDGIKMVAEVQATHGEARDKKFGMPFEEGHGYGEITSIRGNDAASLPDHDSNGVGEKLDIFFGSGEKKGAHFFVFSQTTGEGKGKTFDEPKVVIATSLEEAQRLYAESWADKSKAGQNYTAVTEMSGRQFNHWQKQLHAASDALKGPDGKVPVDKDGKPILSADYLGVADAAQWAEHHGHSKDVHKQQPVVEERPAPAPVSAQTPKPVIQFGTRQESAQDQLSVAVATAVYNKSNGQTYDKAAVTTMESFIVAHGGTVDKDTAHLSTAEREALGKMILDPKLAKDVTDLGVSLGAKGVTAPTPQQQHAITPNEPKSVGVPIVNPTTKGQGLDGR